MDPLKVEIFESDNGPATFPWFRSLNAQECEAVRRRQAWALRLDTETSGENIISKIRDLKPKRKKTIDNLFVLARELAVEGVDTSGKILINWYRFDRIDEMNIADVSSKLESIWYPRADDIEIFDWTFSWLASIFYFSVFAFYRLPETPFSR